MQPEYTLYDRDSFEGALQDLTVRENIAVVTYYSLASGFLSGKYRNESDPGQSQRGSGIANDLNPRGFAIIRTLETVAEKHQVKPAEVILAWLIHQPGVTAPIASATNVARFVTALSLDLSTDDIAALTKAGA